MKIKRLLSMFVILLMMICVGCENDVVVEPEPLYLSGPIRIITKDLNSLEDLKTGVLAVQKSFDKEYSDYVIEQLSSLELTEDNFLWFSSYAEIKPLLDNGEIDAWVLPDKREDTVADYRSDYVKSEYKTLETYYKPYYEEETVDDSLLAEDLYTKPFMVMLNGLDGYGKNVNDEWYKYRSDVNHILVVNPELKHVLIVSIPRDTYVKDATSGVYTKLTHVIQRGADNSAKTVSDLLDIDINYYCLTSFTWFVYGINQLGGVTVDVPMNVYLDQNSNREVKYPQEVSKGEKNIFGEATLALARNRKYNGIVNSDFGRIRNQALIINSLIEKIAYHPYLLDMVGMDWLFDYLCVNNFTKEEKNVLFELAKTFEDGYTVDNYFIAGEGFYGSDSLYYARADEDSLEIAKGKINLVMNGELSKDDPHYAEILSGYITGGAGTIEDGDNGYIGEYYDLKTVFTNIE